MDYSRKILIMLSTYCGEHFLQEQLDSIFNQTEVAVHLLVRDDGSTDKGKTLSILREYQRKHFGQLDIVEGKNVGWRKSFMELVHIAASKYASEYSFYAFADQDDIWLPKKLTSGISYFGNDDTPELYCSNLFRYANGVNEGLSQHVIPTITKENALIRNYATGCTIVLNTPLLLLMHQTPRAFSVAHDFWAFQIAACLGNVHYDAQSYILYRQHENNQIGLKSSKLEIWQRRIRELQRLSTDHTRERMAQMLLTLYQDQMDIKSIQAVEKVAYYRKNIRSRIRLFSDTRYTTNRRSNDFWLKLRILLGHL